MQTFFWLAAFLYGIGAIVFVLVIVGLLRFLFGGSSRLERGRAPERHRGGVVSILARIVFFAWSVTLLASAAIFTALMDGRRPLGCDFQDLILSCTDFAGGRALAWYLSLPDWLAASTGLLFVVLRALPTHFRTGFSNLPATPSQLAAGLIGPILLLLAWWGLVKLVGDIRRLWRGW